MKTKIKKISLLILLLVLVVGIGYATLRLNIQINGITKIKNNNFSVKFANLEETTGSVVPNSAATIGSDNTSVDFNVELSNPGEFYGFTLDVVNDGTLNAEIEKLEKTALSESQQKYLTYDIKYVSMPWFIIFRFWLNTLL